MAQCTEQQACNQYHKCDGPCQFGAQQHPHGHHDQHAAHHGFRHALQDGLCDNMFRQDLPGHGYPQPAGDIRRNIQQTEYHAGQCQGYVRKPEIQIQSLFQYAVNPAGALTKTHIEMQGKIMQGVLQM